MTETKHIVCPNCNKINRGATARAVGADTRGLTRLRKTGRLDDGEA